MISSRIQTAILILALLTTITQATEPNNPAENLTFVLKREGFSVPFSNPVGAPYTGIFIVKASNVPNWTIDEIMTTPVGKTLSNEQKKLMFETDCIQGKLMNPESHEGMVCLLGVSEAEVKKLAQAVVEAADKRAQENKEFLLKDQAKLNELRTKKEEALSKIESELKYFNKFEPGVLDVNLIKFREGIIFDTTKLIYQIQIDIDGLQSKLKEIDSQINRFKQRDANQTSAENIIANLEKMKTEFNIELAGLIAKYDTARAIKQRENDTIEMCRKKERLENDMERLTDELKHNKLNLEVVEHKINNPPPENKPIEIFENKVTIYTSQPK